MIKLFATQWIFMIFSFGNSIPADILRTGETTLRIKDEAIKIPATITNSTGAFPDIEISADRDDGNTSRRIMRGREVLSSKRPYMVYLQLTQKSAKLARYQGWLCGGVVVHRHYVLTSAACVEDADHFYVVSGTRKYCDGVGIEANECVAKNRRRVTWKCVPKNYQFDIEDSVKWSSNDIAIIKVERPFRFGHIERGCDHAVEPIQYNNISKVPEKAKTKGYIAGWGSKGAFREGSYRRRSKEHKHNEANKIESSPTLQEARVVIMDKKQCAKRWAPKFRKIITDHMLCTRQDAEGMSEVCNKKYANCTEMDYDFDYKKDEPTESDADEDEEKKQDEDHDDEQDRDFRSHVDMGRHLRHPGRAKANRRAAATSTGGFCENDHGGPLIVKHNGKDLVTGVISACKINTRTHACQGPFLYTSVFNNRQFISCSIYKSEQTKCRRVFRAGIDHEEYDVNWKDAEQDHKGAAVDHSDFD